MLIPAYLLSGWSVLETAGRNILRGQVLDENFLMTIATLGAIAVHKIPEAVGVRSSKLEPLDQSSLNSTG